MSVMRIDSGSSVRATKDLNHWFLFPVSGAPDFYKTNTIGYKNTDRHLIIVNDFNRPFAPIDRPSRPTREKIQQRNIKWHSRSKGLKRNIQTVHLSKKSQAHSSWLSMKVSGIHLGNRTSLNRNKNIDLRCLILYDQNGIKLEISTTGNCGKYKIILRLRACFWMVSSHCINQEWVF